MKRNYQSYAGDHASISSKEARSLNLFWAGFIIYIFSYTLSITGYVNYILFQTFQIIGLMLIIFPSLIFINFKIIEDKYLRNVFIIYCCWLLSLILRGIVNFSDYNYVKTFFLEPTYGGMLYFSPLLLLFPQKLAAYKKLFDVIFIFCIAYLIYDLLFLRDLINSDWGSLQSQAVVELSSDISFPCGFLLLTYAYQTSFKKIAAVVAIALTLLFSIIRARRGLILMTSGIIIASYLLYFFTSKRKSLVIYLSILGVILSSMYALAIYKPNKQVFGSIMERGVEDTRTGVERWFYADMQLKDWIIGRGINGEYYCPGIEVDRITNNRSVIETGYLQTILKGGIISLGLFLLIAVPAIIKGLFYSKNLLSKGAAIWIFLAITSMYPATVNTFTLRYLLVWISIGICYSKKISELPDSMLKEYFVPKSFSKVK